MSIIKWQTMTFICVYLYSVYKFRVSVSVTNVG